MTANLAMAVLLGVPRSPRLSVLAYHRILPEHDPLLSAAPSAQEFEHRMHWVKANFDVLPLSEAARALRENRLPKRALSITFDDGYADNYNVAAPILLRLGLAATFFVATGFLDGGCMFNDVVIEALRCAGGAELDLDDLGLGRHPLGDPTQRAGAIDRILARLKYFETERRRRAALEVARRAGSRVPADLMMTSEQVRSLHAAGMEIGAHTVTHPILAEIPLGRARHEMAASRARLEQIVGAPVRLFAYPNGSPRRDYHAEHAALARELGFTAAVSTAWGAARAGDDLYQIPRFTPWDRADWRFGLRLAHNAMRSDYARA
ncbi:MAG TPA: polysaccharide deacetylase family protein [Burkholderiales bacterium]|jgi:peptidoglycan/xylan/chitin deacetylase (PgdA/CDA1 family)|nr:polysaccharide deacetylase family protein [Burkholderiales bacterium]